MDQSFLNQLISAVLIISLLLLIIAFLNKMRENGYFYYDEINDFPQNISLKKYRKSSYSTTSPNTNKYQCIKKSRWVDELWEHIELNQPPKLYRDVVWEKFDDTFEKYTTKVNNYKLSIKESESGGEWRIEVFDEDNDLYWEGFTFNDEAAKYIAVIKADPSYWDKNLAGEMLVLYLESLDYQYLNIETAELFGWDELFDEDKYEEDENEKAIKFVLIDGTTVIYNNDKMRWEIEK